MLNGHINKPTGYLGFGQKVLSPNIVKTFVKFRCELYPVCVQQAGLVVQQPECAGVGAEGEMVHGLGQDLGPSLPLSSVLPDTGSVR